MTLPLSNKISGKKIKKQSLPTNRIKGSFNTGMVRANDGQTKQLLKLGPFRVRGECAADSAIVVMRSTVDNANSDSGGGDELDNFDFDAGVDNNISYEANTTSDQVAFYGDTYSGWIAVAPRGKRVYRGNAYAAKGLGADCKFLVEGQRIK